MAALDFPEALSDGQVFNAPNGVTYTYVGTPPDGYWSAAVSGGGGSGGNQDLQSVTDEGNETTNDILIGGTLPSSPNITLQENGRIKTTNELYVTSTAGNPGVSIYNNSGTSSDKNALAISDDGGGTPKTIELRYDGSATFVGNITKNKSSGASSCIIGDTFLRVYDTPNNIDDYRITLESDGSAKFARTVTIGDGTNADPNTSYSLLVYNDGDSNNPTIYAKNFNDSGVVFRGSDSNTSTSEIWADGTAYFGGTLPSAPNITLNANGSVEFAGRLTTYSGWTVKLNTSIDSGCNLIQDSSSNAYSYLQRNNGTIEIGGAINAVPASSKPNISLNANGSSTFTGQMQIGGDIASTSGTRIYSNGALYLRSDVGSSANIFKYYNGGFNDASEKIAFRGDGSATFAGSILTGSSTFQGAGTAISSAGNIYIQAAANTSASAVQVVNISDFNAPVVDIRHDGSAEFAQGYGGFTASGVCYANRSTGGVSVWEGGLYGSSTTSVINADGSAEFAGDMRIGGTLPSSPNITLAADGSVRCADSLGVVSTSRYNTHNIFLINDGTITTSMYGSGSHHIGGTLTGAESSSAPNISLNAADGSATFSDNVLIDKYLTVTNSDFSSNAKVQIQGDADVAISVYPATPGGARTIELRHDGSATFQGTLELNASYKQKVQAVSSLDINMNLSNYFTKTISSNSVITISNPPPSGVSGSFTLEVTYTSGTITWPASVKWSKDKTPTLTAGKTTLFMFVTDNGGASFYGSALVDYVN